MGGAVSYERGIPVLDECSHGTVIQTRHYRAPEVAPVSSSVGLLYHAFFLLLYYVFFLLVGLDASLSLPIQIVGYR